MAFIILDSIYIYIYTLLEKILVLLMCITCKIYNKKLILWPCYKLALQTVPVHEPLHLSCVCRNILPHSPHNLDDMNVSINLVDGGYITFNWLALYTVDVSTIHIQSEFPCCGFVICVIKCQFPCLKVYTSYSIQAFCVIYIYTNISTNFLWG